MQTPDFYGTRLSIEVDVLAYDDNDRVAHDLLEDILVSLIERPEVLSCSGEIGERGLPIDDEAGGRSVKGRTPGDTA